MQLCVCVCACTHACVNSHGWGKDIETGRQRERDGVDGDEGGEIEGQQLPSQGQGHLVP